MRSSERFRSVIAQVDERVDETPADRNRAADFLRVAAICVVILWHWVFSITHRQDGQIVNPNPIEHVAGGWLLTWLFQVMPIFFIIGGFANLTGWDSVVRSGQGTLAFVWRRLGRLVLPALVFILVWVIIDVIARVTIPDYTGALNVMPLVFTPLWFLAAYTWATLMVPLTARMHRRFGPMSSVFLGVAVAVVDVGRFAGDQEWLGYVNSAVVWIFVHQLGYLWRDGYLDQYWRRCALAVGGYSIVALATVHDAYPRSMVSIPGEQVSPMWPTTAVIAALAIGQTGLIMLAAPILNRWLQRRVPYRLVVLLGGVLLTVFLWHMTAMLAAFLAAEGLGFTPVSEPTAEWWMRRPLWLIAPVPVLAILVAIFAPIEQRIRRALSLS
ncbi:acyltransferase family protein [Phytoactinopolyspora halophila]|nr:acyltransferase [Phytoactinopolyspora halophila]